MTKPHLGPPGRSPGTPTSLPWLVLVLAGIWLSSTPAGLIGASLFGALVGVRRRSFSLGFVATYGVMETAVHVWASPYSGFASRATVWPVLMSVTIIAILWEALAHSPASRVPASLHEPPRLLPGSLRFRTYVIAAAVGLAANALRFSTGVPLLAENIDASRQDARANASLIVGLAQEAWTVGLLVAAAHVLVARTGRRVDLAFLIFFAAGAFAGGSRNSLLIGVVPALIAAVAMRGAEKAPRPNGAVRPHARPRVLAAGVMGGALVVASFYFAGVRTLAGRGQFETAFRSMHGDSPWSAAVGAMDLALSAPLETWSRIYAQGADAFGPTQFATAAWLGRALEAAGFHPDMNAIAASASSPYYMNATTLAGPPFVDFGIGGVVIMAIVLGVAIGTVDRKLATKRDVTSHVLRGYAIYVAFLSLYSFVPYTSPAWIVVTLALLALRRWARRHAPATIGGDPGGSGRGRSRPGTQAPALLPKHDANGSKNLAPDPRGQHP